MVRLHQARHSVWSEPGRGTLRPFDGLRAGRAQGERLTGAGTTWTLPVLLTLVMTQCTVVPRVAQAQAQAPAAQAAPAAQTPSIHNGKMIFESRCIACHSLDANRIGPALQGVVGRVAGKAPDFTYSKALGAASHRWERDKLLAWLTNPEALVPGQGMGYSVEKADDRRDVVAYLGSVSAPTSAPVSGAGSKK